MTKLNLEQRICRLEKLLNINEGYEKWVLDPKGDKIEIDKSNSPADQLAEVEEYVTDKICSTLGISEEDYETLLLTLDDDSNAGDTTALFTRLLKSGKGIIPKKTLYRGVSKKEYDSILNTGHPPFKYTMSFTESEETAQSYGEYTLKVKFKTPVFPVWYLVLFKYNTFKKSLSKQAYQYADRTYDIKYDLEIVSEESEWQASSSTVFIMKDDGAFVTTDDENKFKPGKSTKDIKSTSLDELTPAWKPIADLCKRYSITPKLYNNQTVTGGEFKIPEEIFGRSLSVIFNYFYKTKDNDYFPKDHVCCTIWIGGDAVRLNSSQLTNVDDLVSVIEDNL